MPRAAPVPRSPSFLVSAVVAAVTAAGLFVIGYSGGSYDIVDRQTAALVIWWAVGVGALVVAPGPRRPGTTGLLVTLFAALIAAWIAVNLGDSISVERSVTELGRAVTHLGPVVLIGWVLPARYWRAVFAGLLLAAVAVLVASLITRLSPGAFGEQTSVVFSVTQTRLAFPFGYWNAIGSWSVMTTLLLLATSAHSPRWYVRSLTLAAIPIGTTVGYLTYSRSSIGALVVGVVVLYALSKNRWTMVVHLGAAALAALVAIITVRGQDAIADGTGPAGAGTVVLALVVTGLVLALVGAVSGRVGLDRVRLPLRAGRIVAAVTVVAAVIVGGVLASSYGEKAWHQFENTSSNDGADPTARLTSLNGTRISQWRTALHAYDDNKLHGTGAGTFEITNNLHNPTGEFVRDAHNAFIETLSEQGFVGLLLLVGLIASVAAAVAVAIRRAAGVLERGLIAGSAAALASFTLGTGVDWFWEVTALAMLAMTLAGVIVAAGQEPRPVADVVVDDDDAERESEPDAEPVRDPGRDRRSRTWPLRTAIVLVAIVAVLVELPGLVGTSDIRRSARDVSSGDLIAARTQANQAIDTMPWASSPFLQRGLVDEQAGQWTSAVDALHLAMKRDPLDWRLPLVLVRIEAKAGHADEALAAYRRAKSLRPKGAFFRG